jgi:hypothetical protein
MMDQKVNPIQPPPSVDDLLALGSDARLGQVDFAHRLATSDQDHVDAPVATVTSVLPRRLLTEAPPEADLVPEPEPEPAPTPEPTPEVEDDTEVEDEPEGVVEPAPRARPRPAAKAAPKQVAPRLSPPKRAPSKRAAARKAASEPPVEPPVEPSAAEPVPELAEGPTILPIAHFADAADVTTTLRMPMEPAEDPRPAPPTRTTTSLLPEEPSYIGGSVQEVVDAAIERLRDAENASLQHLAALEAEATRRAELLTAQAELDAELIRITARREAHAIISAARTQAGLGNSHARDGRQLAEISDAVSRFAESIESSLEPMRSRPPMGDQT